MTKKVKRKISIGIVLLILALFAAFALASYDRQDWGKFWDVRNLCGPIGALLAGSLRYLLGTLLSWFLPLFLLYWSLLVLRGATLGKERKRFLSSFVLFWAFFSLVRVGGYEDAGGALCRITSETLGLIAGRIGSILILAAVVVLTSILLFFGSVHAFFARLRSLRIPNPLALFARRTERQPHIEVKEKRRKRAAKKSTEADVKDEPPVSIAIEKPQKPKPQPKPAARTAVQPSDPSWSAMQAPLPELSLLDMYEERKVTYSKEELLARSDIIKRKLQDYGLDGTVKKVRPGPVVTTY